MSEDQKLLAVLRQSADAEIVDAIETLIREAPDHDLNRINALAFAAKHGLDEERVIAAFLHAARLGLFEMSWNVLCPGCGGVLEAGSSLKIRATRANTAARSAPPATSRRSTRWSRSTFTVSPRVRRIAAHDPDTLPLHEYMPPDLLGLGHRPARRRFRAADRGDHARRGRAAGRREGAILSLQLPAEFVIVFEPVTHAAQFIDVKGEPTRERQSLSLVFNESHPQTETLEMRPGPLRISLENRTDRRVLPVRVGRRQRAASTCCGKRRPFLTAKRLLTNQTFRDIYRTDTLDVDQRLKITSLTFLFTDLKGSTELYERVGDLVAYDLVREHFRVLHEIVASEAGAVVKTIGDAVMATFPTPDRAVAAALRMREAMRSLNEQRGSEDLLLKIGIHEGPCLAVTLNDRQDYFGQTVNIASRVQGLAMSRSIFATDSVVENPEASQIIETQGLRPTLQKTALRGLNDEYLVYEIP